MSDIVDIATRSRMMAGIKCKNTQPECLIRSALHTAGFRFRLHRKDLPGKPDIVLARYKAVVFVNGCFWHGHECSHFKWPATRPEFWRAKITTNIARDERNQILLSEAGWRTAVVWECAIKRDRQGASSETANQLASWLQSPSPRIDISSNT